MEEKKYVVQATKGNKSRQLEFTDQLSADELVCVSFFLCRRNALGEQVAMFGILGLELDLCRCTEEEKDQLKEAIVCYKKLQPNTKYVTGFYMETGSLKSGRNARVSVPHVDGGGRYMVNGQIINGSVIKHGGLRVPVRFNGANGEMAVLKGDYCSALSWMERLKEETQ